MNKIEVCKEFDGIKIERFLKNKFPHLPYSLMQKILRKKLIKAGRKKVSSSFILRAGQKLILPIFLFSEEFQNKKPKYLPSEDDYKKYILKNIIFENNNFLAINKPFGVAVQGGSKVRISIDNLLIHHQGDFKPKLVHRLDKDTTGVLLVAKNNYYTKYLAKLFKEKNIKKTYLAITSGIPKPKKGIITSPLTSKKTHYGSVEKVFVDVEEGKEAITKYEVVKKTKNNIALVKLFPTTGRTHQIRVHLDHIGAPILGDGKYGGKNAFFDGFSNNMHLHAKEIEFSDEDGKEFKISAPIHGHFLKSYELI